MPVYITPTQIRRLLGTQTQATSDDDILMWMCEHASRRVDEFCNRKFFLYKQTMNIDWRASYVLCFPEDVHTLISLINGNGAVIPASTTVGGTTVKVQYIYPTQEYPKWKLELGINSGIVFLFLGTPQQAIGLTCWFGFPAVANNGIYTYDAGDVIAETVIGQTAIQTTLKVPTGHYQAGHTLLIEDEMEIIQSVSAGTPNDTLTVSRGASGTTAVAHVNGTSILLNIYNPDIVHATARLVSYLYRQKDSNSNMGDIGISGFGQMILPLSMPQDVKAILNQYVRNSR